VKEAALYERPLPLYLPYTVKSDSLLRGEIESFAERVQRLTPENSRVVQRMVVDVSVCKNGKESIDPFAEAVLPIDSERVLVCLGYNHEKRRQKHEHTEALLNTLSILESVAPKKPEDFYLKVYEAGYEISEVRLGALTPEQMNDMVGLHFNFFDSYEETYRLLTSPHTRVYAAFKNGRIVSTAASEIEEIPLDGTILKIGEITWAATNPTHEGQGLLGALTMRALEQIGDVDLIMREMNASQGAVLKNARKQGSVFSYTYARNEFGFRDCGILEQDTPIQQTGTNVKEYQDLVVAYVPRQ